MKNITKSHPKLVDLLKEINNNYGRGEITSVFMEDKTGVCHVEKQYGNEKPKFTITTKPNGSFVIRFRNRQRSVKEIA